MLKLKTARFALRTRAARLPGADGAARPCCSRRRAACWLREADGTAFRLIGIGASPLLPGEAADRGDLADPDAARRVAAQAAVDALRARFGDGVIGRGRGLGGVRRKATMRDAE